MKKTLILKSDDNIFFDFSINDIKIYNYYKNNKKSLLFKIIRRLNSSLFVNIYCSKWKKEIKNYDVIILFDNGCNNSILKYVYLNKNKNSKIYLWMWNKIDNKFIEIIKSQFLSNVFTYDYNDSIKYKINYVNQFYNTKLVHSFQNKELEYDLFFIGRNKGRITNISKFLSSIEKLKLNNKILIINSNNEYVNYENYLNLLSKSKCILEILKDDSYGLSLRTMESIYFEKKLITNNPDIIKYDFYNPNNIFIIGKDNVSNLLNFINSPYIKNSKKIQEKYSFINWLNQIINFN